MMLKKLARLFVIKTRIEAYAVTYAIALGAIMRGEHYLAIYPGFGGKLLFSACLGVVFLAGAKLLDAVRPVPAQLEAGPYRALPRKRRTAMRRRRHRRVSDNRRTAYLPRAAG